jgi:predicted CXXCH cytochrome family protein
MLTTFKITTGVAVLLLSSFGNPVTAAQMENAVTATSPTDTLTMQRTTRVKSGKEFFKGADHVGAETCKSCHDKQYTEWQDTWHAKMERWPSPDVIVADFDGKLVTFKDVKVKGKDHKEAKLTFSVKPFRKGADYFFTVIDKDAAKNNQTFKIEKVLGGKWDQHFEIKVGDNYYPTPIRWSVEAGAWSSGGYKPALWVDPDGTADGLPRTLDKLPLHRVAEAKCANCHTTGYNFQKDTKGVWQAKGKGELSIACEKCHGPGSLHVNEAKAAKKAGEELPSGTSTIVHPLKDLDAFQQTQVCAQCHGRNTNKKIKDINFPLDFLPGDTDMTDQSVFWSYSGTHEKSQYKYFYKNDWAKRNRQQWQDYTKSAHFNKADMSCLSCHTFHGDWNEAQLRLEPQKLCVSCHTADGRSYRPNVEMFDGSPMQKAGVRCVDCHMSKTGYRSNKTEKGPHPWDVTGHTFMVATPGLQKSSGVRSACLACHKTDGKPALSHIKEDVVSPPFSLDMMDSMLVGKQTMIRKIIGDVRSTLKGVKSQRPEVAALVEQANGKVNFVVVDGSLGVHNTEKAIKMLNEALEVAKRAAGMQ